MIPPDRPRRLRLPSLQRVELTRVSLFSLAPTVRVECPEGILCMVGGNGIGKSTLLTTVNYALTGIVPDPRRRFESVREYYRESKAFVRSYYEGRIAERDRAAAEVTVTFAVGENLFTVTRGLFEQDELRTFRMERDGKTVYDGAEHSGEARDGAYRAHVAEAMRLTLFEQFVFLQHFVFTFDERRHLLFWDQKVLDQVLFLVFGVDPGDAEKADRLRREAERADSRARNANWQATELRNRLLELHEAAASADRDGDHEALLDEHKRLVSAIDGLTDVVERLERSARDADGGAAALSSQAAALRAEYAAAFARLVEGGSALRYHPLIRESIAEHRCRLCGEASDDAVRAIATNAEGKFCPLCGSGVAQPAIGSADGADLESLDAAMATLASRLVEATTRSERLASELADAQQRLEVAREQLAAFEAEHSAPTGSWPARDSDTFDQVLQRYEEQMRQFLEEKRKYYEIRDDRRSERDALQRTIMRSYAVAEMEFVPLFRDLASRFLGIDLTVTPETRRSSGLNLSLEVAGSMRREDHQLSESQRFFIDIALRMALVQYVGEAHAAGTLCVDTPEGSLDIAYESRAGDMFARFAAAGRRVLMTANLNSSQLLLRMAQRCGRPRLAFERMMSWSELSDVQVAEEQLFHDAMAAIDAALDAPE